MPALRTSRRRTIVKLFSLGVSAALLVGLYRSIDPRLVGHALRNADRFWLVGAVAIIIPITVLRSIRFLWVTPPGALPGLGEALRLTLVASALNVFAPAKAGDLVKGYFATKRGGRPVGMAVAMAVYERMCDLVGLIAWCVMGWLIGGTRASGVPSAAWPLIGSVGVVCTIAVLSRSSARRWSVLVGQVLPHRRLEAVRALANTWPELLQDLGDRRGRIVGLSIGLWLVHLVQIWLFAVALSIRIPFVACASLSGVALMAGQVPLTVAGIGPRDVALVVLLARYATPEQAAAMGILIATRGLLPPLAALPILKRYLGTIVDEAREWRAGVTRAQSAGLSGSHR